MMIHTAFLMQQSAMPELQNAVTTLVGGLSLLGFFLGLIILVLGAVWLVVPFSVVGIKGRLDSILAWQAEIHRELQRLNESLASGRPSDSSGPQ